MLRMRKELGLAQTVRVRLRKRAVLQVLKPAPHSRSQGVMAGLRRR